MKKSYDIQNYRKKRIAQEKELYQTNIKNSLIEHIKYPCSCLFIGTFFKLLTWIGCKTPILSIIITSFHLDSIMKGIAMFMFVVGFPWLVIGLLLYRREKKQILVKLKDKIEKIQNYIPDETTLAMWFVIEDSPELFTPPKESLKRQEQLTSLENKYQEYQNSGASYEEEMRDYERKQFSYVDASGAYRRWGEDFIDCKGNWCRWGSGFYDTDGNYIRWGETFRDKSGAYCRWGETFTDWADNFVKCPR